MSNRNALIWRVNRDDHSSYVMGTMHVRDASAFLAMDRAQSLLLQCSHYFSEVDLDDLTNSNPFGGLREAAWSAQAQLGRSYTKIRRILLKAFKLDIQRFDHLEPLFILNMCTEMVLQEDHREAADFHLWNQAKMLGLQCGGIESLEENLQTMRSIDLQGQLRMLKGTMSNVTKFRKRILHLSNLYAEGRIHELYQLSRKDLGKWKHELLYDRNQMMAERLHEHHKSKSVFLAVGAAHLSGKFGVLHRLNLKGFRIEPFI